MANYNSIHTGAEIDAAISQTQSMRGASLSLSVSTSGSSTPADPLNDDFDTLTNAIEWASATYGLVDYLYVDIGAGTFDEGGMHYDPLQLANFWQVPNNVFYVDVLGAGASSTILDMGSRTIRDGDGFCRLSFSGVKLISGNFFLRNGIESYDDFTFESSSSSGFTTSIVQGPCYFYGNVSFSHAGSTNTIRPVLTFLNASVDATWVTTFTIDATANPASGRLLYIKDSFVDFNGITLVNASTSSMDIRVGTGGTLVEPSTLTNCTVTFDNNSIPTRAQAALL